MTSPFLTLLFAVALVASLLTKFWLSTRQARYVAQHRSAVPVAFRDTITLAGHQKAADYTLAKGRFGLLTTAFGTAVLLGWTLLGGLDLLNSTLRDALSPRYGSMVYQLALVTAFVAIGAVLDLPFDLWRTFRLEQRFGFNRMTPAMYAGDLVKHTIVGALVGLPIVALILWIMQATGSYWWVYAFAAWTAINLLVLVLYPTLIAPLFNKFEPLADESLKARVQSLMTRCGFAAKGLFVMDGSRRSAHANAYFTGLGAAKRVVFFDTLLTKLNADEVEAVLAHELGHFKHRHVTQRMVLMFALSLVGFALIGWLSTRVGFYTALGVRPNVSAANDALALLLFLMVVPVFTYFISPLMAGWSRRHEFQADAYACRQSDGRHLAAALLKLHQDNAATLTPDPLFVRFYYSHPPASERLAAMQALPAAT